LAVGAALHHSRRRPDGRPRARRGDAAYEGSVRLPGVLGRGEVAADSVGLVTAEGRTPQRRLAPPPPPGCAGRSPSPGRFAARGGGAKSRDLAPPPSRRRRGRWIGALSARRGGGGARPRPP